MNATPEMKERFLQSSVAMQILQQMVEFEKQKVLNLIREKALLKTVLMQTDRYYEMTDSPEEQERLKNLPPDVEMEMGWERAGYDPSRDPSEWTKAEAQIVNQWWENLFPDEPNPLYLEEEDLPEKLEEPENQSNPGEMTLADLYRT